MQIELRQIQRTVGTTTILVTHDQAEAMALSDRIVVMNQGRAEQIGPPHEAYERPATPFVANFLGKTNLVNGTTVRPEKISLRAPSGLAGKVTDTRIFQGNHWLYQVDTAGGVVTVIRQNAGEAMPAEGERRVHLAVAAPRREGRRPYLAQPAGAAAVRRRGDHAARHDGAALVPRLGPVQGHRAGLHPEELAARSSPIRTSTRCSGGPSASPSSSRCWPRCSARPRPTS